MNSELTPEQQQQIAAIIEQAAHDGLLTQATNPELSAAAQAQFTQTMLNRIEQLYADALEQKVTHLAKEGAEELRQKFSERLCQKCCDEQGQLQEKYRQVLLGEDQFREFLKDAMAVGVLLIPASFEVAIYSLSLFMVLYFVRMGLDKLCSKCQK